MNIEEMQHAVQDEIRRRNTVGRPTITTPEGATMSQMANALGQFFPSLNRKQRRDIVRNAKKKGKGFTKTRKSSRGS